MDAINLRQALDALNLSQVDLSRLIGVTPRGVNLWATGEREVPGAVAAYLDLLASLPKALQAREISKLEGRTMLTEGLYQFNFTGSAGSGHGVIVVMSPAISPPERTLPLRNAPAGCDAERAFSLVNPRLGFTRGAASRNAIKSVRRITVARPIFRAGRLPFATKAKRVDRLTPTARAASSTRKASFSDSRRAPATTPSQVDTASLAV